MRVAKFLLVIWLAALVGAVAAAPAPRAHEEPHGPQPAPTTCPTVEVNCPDAGLFGEPITFTANISGADPAVTPTYRWTVPGFRILSYAGAPSITVEPPAQGGAVVATVEVGGYDPACVVTASCTTNIIVDPLPRRLGEYVGVWEEKTRLGGLADELRNDPAAQGYLICYGGRRSRRDEARRRCERAQGYLSTHFRGIDALRLVTVDGGFRERPTVELWLVPSGAIGVPVASPTVDPAEVRPAPKPRNARRPGRR